MVGNITREDERFNPIMEYDKFACIDFYVYGAEHTFFSSVGLVVMRFIQT